jgi:hypothetical protein
MRDALLGKPQGSVPSVRPGAPAAASPWGNTAAQPPGYAPGGGYANAPQAPGSSGGSFLGTAAATAAGVVGGALLMNSFRGMFGNNPAHAAYNPEAGGGGEARTPWGGDQAGGDLSRQAGLDDVGRSSGGNAQGDDSRAGLFDTADNDADFSGDYGDDFDGGDSDLA